MSLEEMVLRSELKRERSVPGEIPRLLQSIQRRLNDAGQLTIHPETRLEQAYHAILGWPSWPCVSTSYGPPIAVGTT